MFDFFQRIGKSLMLPIAVLPAAALLLRLGQDDLLDIPFIAAAGKGIFDNLPLIFAIGLAIGFSRDGSGTAALAGVIGYLVLDHSVTAINKEIDMGVLGGIVTGLVAGLLYNRFHYIKLPEWLAFFGGRRFVPIVTAASMVILGGLFGLIWPPIQDAIHSLGQWIIGAGAVGVGVYGFLNRLLIPMGLHHVLNSLVWFVFGDFGGAKGDLNRFFAGDPSAGTFMAGFFPVMMFGLPAAALAMILAAPKKRRKQVAGLLGSIAFTSFLTGITEPIEFTFMFLSPLLYGIHALLTASSFVVTYLLDIHHGFGFSAGAIDFFLNLGLAKGAWLLLAVGLAYGGIYFTLFYLLIRTLDLKTPGRGDEETEVTEVVKTSSDDPRGSLFLEDLGGRDNILSLDYCATRLRLRVDDMGKVEETNLKKHGARGVIRTGGSSIQVIVGTDVQFVADAMKRAMEEGKRDQ
ncbi:N-acetylglucosamine-specific PTS transporter subunit IIBC [Salinithrix halophila]|uniref:N-acetylglucosamine-specific PTS transporter subunit IIBC n=1 Tax=Salinithrix halophila TaxID=1485204 RepID=A0ABV8JC82_9BACL